MKGTVKISLEDLDKLRAVEKDFQLKEKMFIRNKGILTAIACYSLIPEDLILKDKIPIGLFIAELEKRNSCTISIIQMGAKNFKIEIE